MLDKINIVLSHTTHPGNIGATARAMKVMGVSKLKLVNPKSFPCAEATERASHADDVLANAQVCQSIEEALSDSPLVVGTSARTRSLPSKLITPRELAEMVNKDRSRVPVSILFGTENSGLTNEELHRCHYHVYIPTNPDYSSLNLASAVQIICYEMRLALSESSLLPTVEASKNDSVINRQQLSGLLTHLEQSMQKTGYLVPEFRKQLTSRVNRLFNKAEVTISELNLLRGFLSSVDKCCDKLERAKLKE